MRVCGSAARSLPALFLASLAVCAAPAGCGLQYGLPWEERTAGERLAEKRAFIAKNPGHPRARRFLRELDAPDFQKASRIHTAAAYDEYLKAHPSGRYALRARRRAERLAYDDALASKNPAALDNFLKRFPESRLLSGAGAGPQRGEYEAARKKDDVRSYRAFIAKYRSARSPWTQAATRRLERLLLDAAKKSRSVLELERYVFDNPGSPYLPEARGALRAARFERAMRSGRKAEREAFVREYEGSKEAALMRRRMEEQALRGAERSGRVSALERYLARYPRSPHRKRILSSIAVMARERNRQAHRWVRARDAEIEAFRKRKCKSCKPYLRVRGALLNTDPDFSFDVVVQVQLIEKGRRCCRVRRRIKHLRPGESRPFSFPVRGRAPKEGRPLPRYEVRIVSGSAYRDPQAEKGGRIEGLDGGGEGPPADRFAPVRMPDLSPVK